LFGAGDMELDARTMNWLANTVLVLHTLIVLFIVGGLITIWTRT